MSDVWSSLKSAKNGHSNLGAIWLDIANAYGSVPHKLIFFAPERYGVPKPYVDLFKAYYIGLWSKLFSANAYSDWHHHQKGIFIGCTASIILILSAMNVLIEFICHHTDPSLSTPKLLSKLSWMICFCYLCLNRNFSVFLSDALLLYLSVVWALELLCLEAL